MKTKVNTKKKVSTKPKSKALKQGAVMCRAYPEMRFRIDNWQGKFYPMVQVSFISWLYIGYDAIHDRHPVGNSHNGCSTRAEALEYIERYKKFLIDKSERENCEYV